MLIPPQIENSEMPHHLHRVELGFTSALLNSDIPSTPKSASGLIKVRCLREERPFRRLEQTLTIARVRQRDLIEAPDAWTTQPRVFFRPLWRALSFALQSEVERMYERPAQAFHSNLLAQIRSKVLRILSLTLSRYPQIWNWKQPDRALDYYA